MITCDLFDIYVRIKRRLIVNNFLSKIFTGLLPARKMQIKQLKSVLDKSENSIRELMET